MTSKNKDYIAVDIAKDSLQVQAPDCARALTYNTKGLNTLIELIKTYPKGTMIVCEATGGYERMLMSLLWKKKIPVALLNPARVRAFAISEGLKAKTDPLDAKMLLRFAQQKHPDPALPPPPEREKLAALLDRRSHLTEMLAREKNRLENSSQSIHSLIRKMIRVIEKDLKALEKRIRALVESKTELKQQFQIMRSVDGIGEVTAWSILAYMSEITQVSRNQLVALVGVAPYNRDSGKTKRKRKIQGGRAKIRGTLFMAAKSAANCNPHIKTYVDHLRFEKGKPYKCAITAAMRKLLIHLQSLLKNYENQLV